MASGSKKVVIAALIGNGLISITKFIAAAFTGSSAMMSEGIHSLVDTGNQVLLLFGMHKSKKPASADFPFGHGKEIYFWSFVVAMLLFAIGAVVSVYEGIHRLQHPEEMKNFTISYVVLGLAICFEAIVFYVAIKEFLKVKGDNTTFQAIKRSKDPALFVVLFEDAAAMSGLLVALAGVALTHITGQLYWDGIASIIIGLILGGTAIWLATETKGLLIGESASLEINNGIREILRAETSIVNVNEVSTLHMGPEFILATISVDFKPETLANSLEETTSDLTAKIKELHPRVKRVFIEAESLSKHTAGF